LIGSYQRGRGRFFTQMLGEPYLVHIPEPERGDLLAAYHRRLTSDDPAGGSRLPRIWSGWEGATSKAPAGFRLRQPLRKRMEFALAFARIEAHYFVNQRILRNR